MPTIKFDSEDLHFRYIWRNSITDFNHRKNTDGERTVAACSFIPIPFPELCKNELISPRPLICRRNSQIRAIYPGKLCKIW